MNRSTIKYPLGFEFNQNSGEGTGMTDVNTQAEQCYTVFLNGVELPNFGRHETSQDATCAVMRSGLSGYALEGVTVDAVRS